MDWLKRVETLAETAAAVQVAVAGIPDLDAPGLGSWNCRQLAGHALRALTTLRNYAAEGTPTDAQIHDAAGYFTAFSAARRKDPAAMDAAIAGRAVADAVAHSADELAHQFDKAIAWVRTSLAAMDSSVTVPTRMGTLSLGEYVRTRNLELVVHGFDIAHAGGGPFAPPDSAVRDVAEILTEMAVRTGTATPLILALTGRRSEAPVVLR